MNTYILIIGIVSLIYNIINYENTNICSWNISVSIAICILSLVGMLDKKDEP